MAVYLDHNSTAPMHPEVVDAMMPFLQNPTGNPSSLHSFGRTGKAAQIARLEMVSKRHHLQQLRDVFESRLLKLSGAVIFGQSANRLPNTTYFALPYYHGETLLMELDRSGFALSCGSACHSEVTRPSDVLTAMGIEDQLALNAIRVSFGMSNTLQEVDMLVVKLEQLVNKLPAVIRRAAV